MVKYFLSRYFFIMIFKQNFINNFLLFHNIMIKIMIINIA